MKNLIKITLLICLFFVGLTSNAFFSDDKPASDGEIQKAEKREQPNNDVDFTSYMKFIQKAIKRNWEPPKRTESKRVIVLFTVLKNGELDSIKIHKSSKDLQMDRSAIKAVKATAPFDPLPKEFKGKSVDIQFTFDYNVFDTNRHKIGK